LIFSRQTWPESVVELLHFRKFGTIPTRSLHLLHARCIDQLDECMLCGLIIHPGSVRYQLPCGHAACAASSCPTSDCNLAAWLKISNRCPRCCKLVTLVPNNA
jgi:hypothetical protein